MIEWRKFCVGASDIVVNNDSLTVQFSNGRRQRLEIREDERAIELRGIVVRRATADEIPEVALAAWERNRASGLIGFRQDDRGRVVGEGWVPAPGLTREEFLFYVRKTASACDLFEFQLAGHDRE